MRSYSQKIIFLIFLLCSCIGEKKDQTWDVIAVGIPEEITTKVAMINMGLYVLKQTHEPILRVKNRNEYISNILREWERDASSKKFKLCVKDGLTFDTHIPALRKDIIDHIRKITKQFDKKAQINLAGSLNHRGCVWINFDRSMPSYLEYLTQYENAPTLVAQGKKWELGLGPFRVVHLAKDTLELERKVKVKNGHNKIRFHSYSGSQDQILQNKNIEDFNRVFIGDLPAWIKAEYNNYGVALFQTVNLLINVQDRQDRETIYHCLDIDKFRRAFMPKQQEFADIQNVLPMGVPGSKKGKAQQNCNSKSSDKEYLFYNWNKTSRSALQSFFVEFHQKTGITIKIVDISKNDFVNIVLKSPHPYHLTVVAIDAVRADYDAYFAPLVSKKSVFDIELPQARKVFKKIANLDGQEKLRHIDLVNQHLANSALILPLYQEIRKFYFPKQIKNLKVGGNDLEYIEVGELEI